MNSTTVSHECSLKSSTIHKCVLHIRNICQVIRFRVDTRQKISLFEKYWHICLCSFKVLYFFKDLRGPELKTRLDKAASIISSLLFMMTRTKSQTIFEFTEVYNT